MKKKIFSVALLAMSLFAVNGIAQNPANNNDNTTKVENVKGKKADKKGKKAAKNPFEGLNLTEAQKTQLKQLDEKRMAERKQKAEAMKAEKQRNDSVSREARKASKKQYLEEVKAIIGPDNYVVFLENFYINGGQQGGKQMKQAPRGGDKNFAHKKGQQGKKGEGRKGDMKKGQKEGQKGARNNDARKNATTAQI